MGNISAVDINSPIDGSIDDIFRLIFNPDGKCTEALISSHVDNYPDVLNRHVYCVGLEKDRVCGNPLFLACMFSNTRSSNDIVSLLIKLHAPLDTKVRQRYLCLNCFRGNSFTPLMISSLLSHTTSNIETVTILLNAGANKEIRSCCKTILHLICHKYNEKHMSTLQLLLNRGVDPDATYFDERTYQYKTAYDDLLSPPITSYKMQASEIIKECYLKNNVVL